MASSCPATAKPGGGAPPRRRPRLEIQVEGPRVRAATGFERIVLPWSETVRYGTKRNGYHGGVSLQEAVVPVGVYVGPGENLEVHGWEPVPVPYPSWWFPEAPGPAPIRLPAPELEIRRDAGARGAPNRSVRGG